MPEHESINNHFPLLGKSITLFLFTETHVNNEDIDEIINEHIAHGRKVKRLLI